MTSPVRSQFPSSLFDDHQVDRALRPTRLRKYEENNHRRRLIGEEHWTKVLQVNVDINNVRSRPCSRSPSPSPRHRGPFLRHQTPSPRHLSPSSRNPSPSPRSSSPSQCKPPQRERKRSRSLGRTGEGIFQSLSNRFRNWIHSKRKYEISPTNWIQTDVWNKEQVFNEDVSLRSYRSSVHESCASVNSDNSVKCKSVPPSENPDCERTVVQITYTGAEEDDTENLDASFSPPYLLKHPVISGRQLLRASRYKHREKQLLTVPTSKQPLTGTISCPPKQQSVQDGSPWFRRRCATWPLHGRKHKKCEDSEDDDLDSSFLRDSVFERSVLDGKKSLEDFSIQYEDLTVCDSVRVGRTRTILRGRWHGDVTIHLFGDMADSDKDAFWSDVTKLCRIRHENINLFMGACTAPPNRAVITSAPEGMSLYDKIHTKREKLAMHSKVQLLRQIAVGMGYLHAKDIVLRKLNTKNVFLSPKVKISAMDYGFSHAKYDRKDYSSIPRGHLTYVAPEILSTMVSVPPRLVTSSTYTNETDVFAFGTVMYEVLCEQFPYDDVPVESLIWQVCHGLRQDLHALTCTGGLKDLIEDCWAHESFYRPDFPELSKELHKNSPMYKRHSSSEPERLHRTDSFLDLLSPF